MFSSVAAALAAGCTFKSLMELLVVAPAGLVGMVVLHAVAVVAVVVAAALAGARAASEVKSSVVPLAWAARPPLLAISRCFVASIDAKPRLLVLAMCVSFGFKVGTAVNCGALCEAAEVGCTKGAHSQRCRSR